MHGYLYFKVDVGKFRGVFKSAIQDFDWKD